MPFQIAIRNPGGQVGWKTIIDEREHVYESFDGTRRLTILDYDHTDWQGFAVWRAQCSCGKECLVLGVNLRRKGIRRTQSCGCLRTAKALETLRQIHKRKKKEGDTQ